MNTLLVSGASGWMGRSAIAAWLKGGHRPESVLGITRRTDDLVVMGNLIGKFQGMDSSYSLGDITFVHTAFVTRELYDQVGPRQFDLANHAIILEAQRLIETLNPRNIIFVNSGASQRVPIQGESDPSFDAYAAMKRQEREAIYSSANKVGASVVEGVLFSASGIFMKDPLKFAIGSFLNQALTSRSVSITSKGRVWRRYCDSVEFLEVLFHNAGAAVPVRIESGGQLVELEHLVKEIELLLGFRIAIEREVRPIAPDDFYFSTSNDYEKSLLERGQPQIPLNQQLRNVLSALGSRIDN